METSNAFNMGFLMGLGLIVSIGPQNAYVLRQAALGEGRGIVFSICVLSDVTLISVGVLGLGQALSSSALLLKICSAAGFIFVCGYALSSFSALRATFSAPEVQQMSTSHARSGRWAIAATALSLSILNPYALLDTLLLLGATGGTLGDGRLAFSLGAATASIMWFASLISLGARLSRFLQSISGQRIIHLLTAICMLGVAFQLGSHLYNS
jgi:L-lysine exporter family protein LysE/ArgO